MQTSGRVPPRIPQQRLRDSLPTPLQGGGGGHLAHPLPLPGPVRQRREGH